MKGSPSIPAFLYDRAARLRLEPFPPHVDGMYDCSCTACDEWREVRVLPGSIVKPVLQRNDGCPIWAPGTWTKSGWGIRMHQAGITHGTVVGYVDPADEKNAGHLSCVVLLCSDSGLWVTARRWLVVK